MACQRAGTEFERIMAFSSAEIDRMNNHEQKNALPGRATYGRKCRVGQAQRSPTILLERILVVGLRCACPTLRLLTASRQHRFAIMLRYLSGLKHP
jgi:hypothetical protein